MSEPLVHLKGGMVVAEGDLLRLLDLESSGIHFSLAEDGRVRVSPSARLTDDDRAFLAQHHDLVIYALTFTYTDHQETT